jgi:hypothetical protein
MELLWPTKWFSHRVGIQKHESRAGDPSNAVWAGPVSALRWVPLSA